ncbi:hypothetical protein ACUXVY_16150 [Chromobacterium haemolyticum]|uniref:hypothetical protein n=1 Tax=Chromobacterium haemolyticum TaxID=394935 RepID=UPI004055D811
MEVSFVVGVLIDFLKSAVPSVTLLGVLGFLCRKWISERLTASIKHDYDKRLSVFNLSINKELEKGKLDVKHEFDLKLELVRESIRAKELEMGKGFDFKLDLFKSKAKVASDSYQGIIEKRIEALDFFWRRFLNFRNSIPYYFQWYSLFTKEEFYKNKLHERVELLDWDAFISTQEYMEPQERRIYAGEKIWILYRTFSFIVNRIVLLNQNDGLENLYNFVDDPHIYSLIEKVIGEDFADEWRTMKTGYCTWLYEKYEAKLIEEIARIHNGGDIDDVISDKYRSALVLVSKPLRGTEVGVQ